MARGGSRTGTPGTLYPNRSDMAQPTRLPVGKEYGQRQQSEQAQAQRPLPQGGQVPVTAPMDDTRGQIPSLSDPSSRPDEAVTAGLPVGPGVGPEALTAGAFAPQELSVLRAVFLKYPSEDLRRLIEWTEDNL